ncbi:MAG: hypothetical protein VYE81_00045 [Planctomycetota bacterium]|nr:hypothetical protein [Planctomycetota bacterium]
MEERTLGPWTLRCDPEATRRASQETIAASEACGCVACRNYAVQRGEAFGPVLREELQTLGVDPDREADLCHLGRDEDGLHRYSCLFELAGEVIAGPETDADLPAGITVLQVGPEESGRPPRPLVRIDLKFALEWRLDLAELP